MTVGAGIPATVVAVEREAMAAGYDGELARTTIRRALAGTLVDVLQCPAGGWTRARTTVPDDLTPDAWAALVRLVEGLDAAGRLASGAAALSARVGRPTVGTVRFAEAEPRADARVEVALSIGTGADAVERTLGLAVDIILPHVAPPRTRIPIRIIGIRRDG